MTLLHLMHASQQWSDKSAQSGEDFVKALAHKPDLITFTETSPKNGNLQLLQKAAKPLGYQVLWGPADHPGAETAIAVRPDLEVLEHDAVLVNPPEGGKPPDIGHSARYATWCRVRWDGNDLFLVAAHWVTGFHGGRASRVDEHEAMSKAVVALVQEHGKGARLAFFAGDTNLGEQQDKGQDPRGAHAILTGGHLTTVWDELGVYPSTHGGEGGPTIDVIGSYDPDKRVTAHAARTYADRASDHRPFSAWYEVAPHHVHVPEVPHACPACGLVHLRP